MLDSQIYKSGAIFSIIIANVNTEDTTSVSAEFSRVFSLEPSIAEGIIKSAPVVFLTEVNKQELKVLTPQLVELSQKGIEFRVTVRSTDKIPKVIWSRRPWFAIGVPPQAKGTTIQWNNNVFACPNCGEVFLFRKVGKLPLGETVKLSSLSTETKIMPPPTSPFPPEPDEKTSFKDTDKVAVETSTTENQTEEPLTLAEEVPTLEAVEVVQDEEPVAEFETVNEDDGSLLLEPSGEGGDIADQPLEVLGEVEAVPAEGTEQTGEAEAVPMEGEQTEEVDDGVYNVFLSKITDDKKKREAAKIISEIKGITFNEASALTNRSLIPLLKEVPKAEATAALAKFEKINIFGRMTKL